MELVAAWVVFPLVAVAAATGAGLLVEHASGDRLPGVLLAPVGMAALLAATQLTTYWSWSAPLTIPLVVAVALAGWALGRRRVLPPRLQGWPLAVALGVFAVFGAPIVLTGEATFAGYTVLGDTSVHFIGSDALLDGGRQFGDLAPSSYQLALHVYFGLAGYPAGGPALMGSLSALVGQDVAWTFQPVLALLVAFMSLGIWHLVTPHVASLPLRALIAFVAAQPALVLAYSLQGSIKEIGTVFGVITVAALVPVYVGSRAATARRAAPLAVAAAGAIGVVGLVAALWVAPLAAGALAGALWTQPRLRFKPALREVALFVGVCAALSYQSLIQLTRYVESNGGVASNQSEFGNLLRPLELIQVLGIWITGEYRLGPEKIGTTYALIGVAAIGIVLGLVYVVRRRAWELGLFFAVSFVAMAYILRRGSPWADGKGLMIASPAALLLAMLGAAALHDARRRVEGYALAGAVAVGVLASNAFAYHQSSPAPRDRLTELARIGERIDGHGPTLYTEFEEFAKHFLRRGDPEGAGEGWQPRFQLATSRGGVGVSLGVTTDLDRFREDYVTHYRTIVVRRGFFGSRPPAMYRRTFAGRWYDVWQRQSGPESLVEHLPLGSDRQPAALAPCRALRGLAGRAREQGARLAFVERPVAPMIVPAKAERPAAWFVDPSDGETVRQVGQGILTGAVQVARAGEYGVWVEGSFGRPVEVFADGRRVGRLAYRLNGRRTAELAGTVHLEAGRHEIRLVRGGGSPRPANGGVARLLGPIVLGPPDPGALPVQTVEPSQWRSLCGRELDWVEVLRA